jgi:hypothetical protein
MNTAGEKLKSHVGLFYQPFTIVLYIFSSYSFFTQNWIINEVFVTTTLVLFYDLLGCSCGLSFAKGGRTYANSYAWYADVGLRFDVC